MKKRLLIFIFIFIFCVNCFGFNWFGLNSLFKSDKSHKTTNVNLAKENKFNSTAKGDVVNSEGLNSLSITIIIISLGLMFLVFKLGSLKDNKRTEMLKLKDLDYQRRILFLLSFIDYSKYENNSNLKLYIKNLFEDLLN